MDWAVRLGQDTFGPLGAFRAIEHLKFQATIEPGELIQLELDWDQVTHQLTFAYAGSQGRKSSAVILFD